MGYPSQLRGARRLHAIDAILAYTTSTARLTTTWSCPMACYMHVMHLNFLSIYNGMMNGRPKAWWLVHQPSNFQAIVKTPHQQRRDESWYWKNQIELNADQVQTIFEFLSAQEVSLTRISVYDKENAKQALNKVFGLLPLMG